jgi:hypothetical protein
MTLWTKWTIDGELTVREFADLGKRKYNVSVNAMSVNGTWIDAAC